MSRWLMPIMDMDNMDKRILAIFFHNWGLNLQSLEEYGATLW